MAIWGYALFALAAGAMLPIQFGINAQLARFVDSPVRAALISFAVGTLGLLVVTLAAFRAWPSERVADAPWWVWAGGLLGAFYVLGSIVAAPKLGAVTLTAAVIAGQTTASVLVDQFGWVGFKEHHISAGRLIGVLLVAGGVALVRIF